MILKYKYDRPRPFQLAGVYNKEINIIETGTHSTPAYPSGHTAQGGVCAGLLSALYPEYSSEFYAMVEEVGDARMLQGVQYPSDKDAAMLISAAIWEDIKYKILPNLPTKEYTWITIDSIGWEVLVSMDTDTQDGKEQGKNLKVDSEPYCGRR